MYNILKTISTFFFLFYRLNYRAKTPHRIAHIVSNQQNFIIRYFAIKTIIGALENDCT